VDQEKAVHQIARLIFSKDLIDHLCHLWGVAGHASHSGITWQRS
jgi:hypothetical protein